MIIQNSTDIKTEYFLDKNGDPSPIDVQYEKHVINPNGLVQLRNIPSIHTVFNITTKNGVNIVTYNKVDKIVNQKDFTVDYANGILTFHVSQINKEIQVSYTNAIGRLSISADRIFTKTDNQGNIVQTLNTLIEEGMEVLSDLETIGGANKIINELKGYMDSVKGLTATIIEGSNTNNTLKRTDETAKTTNNTLNSTVASANNKIQEMTEWVDKNGDVVNLNNRVTTTEGKLNTVSVSLENISPKIDELNDFNDRIAPYIVYKSKEQLTDYEIPNTYQEVYNLYDSLVANYPNYITMNVLGIATDGEEIREYIVNAPLLTNNNGERADRRKILITSCIHGDERSGAFSVYKFLKDVLASDTNSVLYMFKYKFMIKVVPVCNPYGYNNNQRWNKNSVDLARNFNVNWKADGLVGDYEYSGTSSASEKETKVIQKFIEDNSVYNHSNGVVGADLLLDIHNTAQGGTEYKPELKDQFTWIISSDVNSNRNKFIRDIYQKAIQNCSVLWNNRHPELTKNKTFGMYSTQPQLSNIENYGIKNGLKSCQLEISWRISELDSLRFGKNTLKIGIETLGNILMCFSEGVEYFSEKPNISTNISTPLSATNGAVTKITFNNIISKTNNVTLTENGGIKVPKGFSKAIVTITTALDKTINTGLIEHRVYVSEDETSNGNNNIYHRNSYQIVNSSSLDKINTSHFIVDSLKTGQVINLIVVQITGSTITLGNNTSCRIMFEK